MNREEIEKTIEPILRKCLREFDDYTINEISDDDFATYTEGMFRPDVRRVSPGFHGAIASRRVRRRQRPRNRLRLRSSPFSQRLEAGIGFLAAWVIPSTWLFASALLTSPYKWTEVNLKEQ
jgi:hypothetical protein